MTWLRLCACDNIPQQDSRGFDLTLDNGEQLALIVVNKGGQLYVYRNNCPHVGVRLEWQEHQFLDFDKQYIHCSSHGALFEMATGQCIAGPCAGDKLDTIPSKVEDGQLWIKPE